MKYFVSRQKYWPHGDLVVEVATGGRDYSNPDMLVPKFPGEASEHHDPREAVSVAIRIADAWKVESGRTDIEVRTGYTHGFTAPFENGSYEDARQWAQKQYEQLEKCEACGSLIEDDWYTDSFGEGKFCSEWCALKTEEQGGESCEVCD